MEIIPVCDTSNIEMITNYIDTQECYHKQNVLLCYKEGRVLFNDALNTFSYGYMASVIML